MNACLLSVVLFPYGFHPVLGIIDQEPRSIAQLFEAHWGLVALLMVIGALLFRLYLNMRVLEGDIYQLLLTCPAFKEGRARIIPERICEIFRKRHKRTLGLHPQGCRRLLASLEAQGLLRYAGEDHPLMDNFFFLPQIRPRVPLKTHYY